MDVKLLVSRAGADFCQNAGDIITVDDEEGQRLIAAEQAVSVDGVKRTKKPETATKKAATEKAVK